MSRPITFQVYLITNEINGKCYVGKCGGPVEGRWKQHIRAARNFSRYALHRAIRKHGKDAFHIETLACCPTNDNANTLEQILIEEKGTFAPGGYNLTKGGEGTLGLVVTPDTRRRMSLAKKGKKEPEEVTRKRADAMRGKKRGKMPPEFGQTVSDRLRGKKLGADQVRKSADGHRGKKRSIDTRIKQSAAAKRYLTRISRDARQPEFAL